MKKILIYLSLILTGVNAQSALKKPPICPYPLKKPNTVPLNTTHATPSTLELPYCSFSYVDIFSATTSIPEKAYHTLHTTINNLVPAEYQQYPQFVEERLTSYNPMYTLPINQNISFEPLDLISWWRFDIVAKYIYAFHYEHGIKSNWAQELYAALLYVWGGAQEWDNSRNNIQEYLDSFHNVIESIKSSGFDADTSKIRIDNRKFPCEGAHRIATALLYNKPVVCYYNPNPSLNNACQATAIFFREFDKYVPNGLDEKYLDAMALQYCELKPDTRMIIVLSPDDHILPNSNLHAIQQLLRLHGNIVYNKTCILTSAGIEYLFRQFSVTPSNITELHATVFLFEPRQAHTFSMLTDILNNHFPDQPCIFLTALDHQNTVATAQTFFVSNSLDLINNEKIWFYDQLHQHKTALTNFVAWIEINAIDTSFLCIDFNNSLPGEQYPPTHQPILTVHYHGTLPIPQSSQLNFVQTLKSDDIIFNPSRHFYHYGIKYAMPNYITTQCLN